MRCHVLVAALILLLLQACSPPTYTAPNSPDPVENPATESAASIEVVEPEQPPGPGDMAPPFRLADAEGNIHDSRELAGKCIVLDWFKGNCDYTRKLYKGHTYVDLPRPWMKKGVHWFTIVSEGPGGLSTKGAINHQFVTSAYMRFKKQYLPSGPMLFDRKGSLARAFGVVRAPTTVVIDENGRIAYFGAPNNAPLNHLDGGWSTLENHVQDALEDLEAGRTVRKQRTRPWGCRLILDE